MKVLKRLPALLCFAFWGFLSAQDQTSGGFINFSAEALTFDEVMEGFEKRMGIYIQYDPMLVSGEKKYSINYKNVKARTALADFLGRNGLTFTENGRQYILKKQTAAATSKPHTLSGRVVVRQSGEFLGNAEIMLRGSVIPVYTTEAGYFSVNLKPDSNFISVYYPGFQVMGDTLKGDRDYFVLYELESVPSWLPEAEVKAAPDGGNGSVKDGNSDQYHITKDRMKRLPHLLGEPDIIRVMSLYPGVVGGSEGMLGMYVRGGASDQNLVLLDDVPVFNSNHLYGIFSIFNDDAIKSAELLKGSFPARYGGRLSSVINVQTKEGNAYRIKGAASIGILSSKIFLEGPLIKNRTTFTLAFRRSYLDFLATPLTRLFLFNDSLQNNVYYFWDVNARVTHRFSYRSRLTLSFYNGRDVGGIDEKNNSEGSEMIILERRRQLSSWGNLVGSLKWNYYPGKKTGITLRAHITEYNYSFNQTYKLSRDFIDPSEPDLQDETRYKLQNGIRDLETGAHLSHKFSNSHSVNGGFGMALHHFIPGNRTFTTLINGSSTEFFYNDATVKTPEYFGYAEWNAVFGKRWYSDAGLRISSYRVEEDFYYILPEPRVALRFRSGDNSWLKVSAMRTRQFFHLLTNLSLGLPSDLWVPSVSRYRPSMSDQVAAGYSYGKSSWSLSTEVFYKKLNHILEYRENSGYITSAANWESSVTDGSGEAYGVEWMAEKREGRLTGWISYACLWNWRQFTELNRGNRFPARYDRRHNLYAAGVYKINENIDFSLSWTYNSGFAITTPVGKYMSPTPYDPYREIFIYGDRNNTRTRDNHRLDLAFTFEKRRFKNHLVPNFTRTWTLGLFNVYNRRNPFYVNLGYNKSGERVLYQVSLLPLLPNISYKVTF